MSEKDVQLNRAVFPTMTDFCLLFLKDRLTYSLTNTEQRCIDMFFIDTANGDIFLKRSFLDISDVTFTVSNPPIYICIFWMYM